MFGVAILFVIVNVTFFPFIWGGRSLQESVNIPSLYGAGSRPAATNRYVEIPVLDPGTAAWYLEPMFAVEHHIIVGQKEPPLWNPYASFGAPLAADAESQPYSPFAWIPIFWSSAEGYDIFIALRIFVGGLFAFLFLRLFLQFIPALVGATAFMFSGYFWLYLTMPHLSVEVLLPAMLYSLERVMRRPGFLRSAIVALVAAGMILGGMPESTILAFMFGAVYFVARSFFTPSLRSQWRAFLPYVLLGTLVGVGISAVMIVPLLEYVPISSNSHSASNFGLISEPLSWSGLVEYLAPLYMRSLGFDLPSHYLQVAKGFFACSALFFALIGFFSSVHDVIKRRGEDSTPVILILGITAIALLAKRFGAGVINWLGALPILRQVIFDKYEEAIIGCCVALLAGFGLSRLGEKRATPGSLWLAALIPLFILTGAATESRQASTPQAINYYIFSVSMALLFLGLAVGAAVAFYAGRLRYALLAVTALALVLLEPMVAYIVPVYYVVNEAPPQSASPLLGAPYVDYLKSHLADNDRLYGEQNFLFPQWSEAFELEDVRGKNGFYPDRYLPFVHSLMSNRDSGDQFTGIGDDLTTAKSQRFFALSSVQYVLTGADLTRSPGYRKIDVFGETSTTVARYGRRMFRFRSPLPRLSVFHRTINVRDGTSALRELTSDSFDPYSEVVVEGNDADLSGLAQSPRSAVSAGDIQEYTATYVKASVTTNSKALVILNDTNFPGWQASIDGRSAPIFSANYLFRGVVVPSGTHVVEFRYAPRSFAIGGFISIASVFVLGCMCLGGLFQTRRRTNARTTSRVPSVLR